MHLFVLGTKINRITVFILILNTFVIKEMQLLAVPLCSECVVKSTLQE